MKTEKKNNQCKHQAKCDTLYPNIRKIRCMSIIHIHITMNKNVRLITLKKSVPERI